MHIADILSRLAGKDLEPSDQLIPISFNVHTRSTRPLKAVLCKQTENIYPLQKCNIQGYIFQTINITDLNQNIH